MGGRPKSLLAKHILRQQKHAVLMSRAVKAYHAELKKPKKERDGLRKVCLKFEKLSIEETGEPIKLCHMTLKRLAEGGRTREEANEERSWLTPGEEELMINFLCETAARGFPFSHRRTKEAVDKILTERLGDEFPIEGVGLNWTYRFQQKHQDRLKIAHSRPLEEKRGRAVNPTNDALWWAIVEDAITEFKIKPENMYGSDEIGIQPCVQGEREHVFAARAGGAPYQQQAGTRENITVIVTICADGTSIRPSVIFKGQAFNVKWGENNPLGASLGYQKKGWTDGEIGVEWIKNFDKETRPKTGPGEHRLLVVDGHNSHYTADFLEYARKNQIVVICYPAHATHIYQGLDVVVFAPLKLRLSQERDCYFYETGEAITKNNFLLILDKAYRSKVTPELIKTAFRKTGLHPFDPSVITPEMFAPSKDTSVEAHLPAQPSQTHLPSGFGLGVLTDMFRKLQLVPHTVEENTVSPLPDLEPVNAAPQSHPDISAPRRSGRVTRSTKMGVMPSLPVSTTTILSTLPSTSTSTSTSIPH